MKSLNLSSSEDEASDSDDNNDEQSTSSQSSSEKIVSKPQSQEKLPPKPQHFELSIEKRDLNNVIHEGNDAKKNNFDEHEHVDEDDSMIEWEDGASIQSASSNDESSQQQTETQYKDVAVAASYASKIQNMQLKPLHLDVEDLEFHTNDDDDDEQTTKRQKSSSNAKRKPKARRKLTHLPESTVELLQSIHQTHLLSLSCRAILLSQACSNDTLLHLAHSLIPLDVLEQLIQSTTTTTSIYIPSIRQVQILCQWFFPFVNQALQQYRMIQYQNRALGAPITSTGTTRQRRSTRKRKHSSSINWTSTKPGHIEEGKGTSSQKLMYICHALSPPNHYQDHLPIQISMDVDSNDDKSTINDQKNHFTLLKEDLLSDLTPHEKSQLLISIARSLGWRVRYVTALQPISTELTVHHPLFSIAGRSTLFHPSILSIYNNFQKYIISSSSSASTSQKAVKTTTHRKKQKSGKDIQQEKLYENNNDTNDTIVNSFDSLAWVEILCDSSSSSTAERLKSKAQSKSSTPKSSTYKWIHIDVHRSLFNQPLKVESFLPQTNEDNDLESKHTTSTNKRGKGKRHSKRPTLQRRRRQPVSFVLAVEHPYPQSSTTTITTVPPTEHEMKHSNFISARVTDVTPRYANVWSQSLALRGTNVTSKKERNVATKAHDLKCSNRWWSHTLKSFNQFFRDLDGIPSTAKKRDTTQNKKSGGGDWNIQVTQMEVTDPNPGSTSQTSDDSILAKKRKIVDVIAIDDYEENNTCNGNVITIDDGNGHFNHDSDSDNCEEHSEAAAEVNEPLPTSKKAFNNHPLYSLASLLNQTEVLSPKAQRNICGMFKGEIVYRRRDVSIARPAKKWLYEGRKVKEVEMNKPIKKIKKKKSSGNGKFKALSTYGVVGQEQTMSLEDIHKKEDDGMEHLYGKWQTEPWTPLYILPSDPLPVNEYNNIEKALINPGLVHMPQPHLSKVARKLGIPYAPCLLGFDGHQGNGTPIIQGIVVHEHNEDILREAFMEWESGMIEKESQTRRRAILDRWTRLTRGLLTRDRLERKYGDGKNN